MSGPGGRTSRAVRVASEGCGHCCRQQEVPLNGAEVIEILEVNKPLEQDIMIQAVWP